MPKPFHSKQSKGITLRATEIEEKNDDLDSLIQQTLDQQQESVLVTERLVKTVANTQEIASTSALKLNSQGEQLNRINKKFDDLSQVVNEANKNASYLKTLNGNIFTTFAAKAPTQETIRNVQFASNCPKGSDGRPIPTPRGTSLTLGKTSKSLQVNTNERVIEVKLDASATKEQKEQSLQYEQSIDKNLQYVRSGVLGLREAAMSMGNELDRQHQVVSKIHQKADSNSSQVNSLNTKIHSNYV